MAKEATAAAGVRRLRDRCCVLTDLLRRNVEVLVREARDALALQEDYVRLQAGYVPLLASVGAAVCRLLAGDHQALDVASDLLGAWLRAEDATRADMRRMRLISRAARGTPVSYLVKRAEETAVRVSAALPDTKPHKRCLNRAAALHEQVKALCPYLVQAGSTLQHLLYLTRALPLLRQFHDKLQAAGVLDDPDQPTATEAAEGGEEEGGQSAPSALYCGGPLWTRLTAEACHRRCRPQRLARLLAALPRKLQLQAAGGPADQHLDADLQRELGLRLRPPEPRAAKRHAHHSPTRRGPSALPLRRQNTSGCASRPLTRRLMGLFSAPYVLPPGGNRDAPGHCG